ncbi:MAG: alanine--tRNA ligase [Caldilineae bacterium]|nr:alanine--tRNA ligase [Caldilineae bacterium]
MNSSEIRQRFLDFFAERGHRVVVSSALVPDDPTLLFVNAGMVQFKDTFLGLESRDFVRAVSAQKCMRVSGKHNDLENVGPSPRHHTFFEMLGNFSFGDYFKSDAIRYGWDFMTGEMGIPPERLVATVHRDDADALAIWRDEIGMPVDRILRMGDKTNFWMMADVGPCGPTSEIHYDFGADRCSCGRADCSVQLDNDCDRWLEVWNLVFMQFDQAADGSRKPLPMTGVDTGMGLERITAIMQGVYANYDTDLFVPILDHVQSALGHDAAARAAGQTGYRVLADHGRAMSFLIADGVLPGNDGRNYVLRLIMRRAMRFGKLLGFEEPFLDDLAGVVIAHMGSVYPELERKSAWIRQVVAEEEARFEATLDAGLDILDGLVEQLRADGGTRIAGVEVFRLYDTYGFPPDLTQVVAEERGFSIDRAGFEAAMAAQRERARASARFGMGERSEAWRQLGLPETRFVGYGATSGFGEVLALASDAALIDRVTAGGRVEIVLDQTPFYAESGGQVGDQGRLIGPEGSVRVEDVQKPLAGIHVHYGRVESGSVARGEVLRAEVDVERRLDIMRNHTATHLLHRALQELLGEHAQQRGSLVAPDRLRFDFAHLKGLTRDELARIEARVNDMVRGDEPVGWQEMSIDAARQLGATMLFGEKYGDMVRVVEIEGLSRELCGGTHLSRTGQIGSFVVTGETSVGSGIRRVEALTGRGAEAYVRERLGRLEALAARLGTQSVDGIDHRVEELLGRNRELQRELESARAQLASADADALLDQVTEIDGLRLLAARVDAADVDALRGQVDVLRERVPVDVIVLGSVIDAAPRLVVFVADDWVARGLHAGKLIKSAAAAISGGGGGRPGLAEAGGRDAQGLDRALASLPALIRDQREA